MDHRIFKWPVLGFVFRHGRAIPIAPGREDPALKDQALSDAAAALDAGELVAIFPEGRITDTGDMYPFRPGMTEILARCARRDLPVVPMALSGLWGSFFSRKDGPAMTRPFRRAPFSRIRLQAGPPVPAPAAAPELMQQRVAELRGDAR